jgi:hypothetical protein
MIAAVFSDLPRCAPLVEWLSINVLLLFLLLLLFPIASVIVVISFHLGSSPH